MAEENVRSCIARRLSVSPDTITLSRIPTGKFNDSFYVTAGERELVVRIAPSDDTFCLFVGRPGNWIRGSRLLRIGVGIAQFRLQFRDTMRKNAELRRQYRDLKEELSHKFKTDRGSYTAGKDRFIRRILQVRE